VRVQYNIIDTIKYSKSAKSPDRFQKKATKEANLVLILKKKAEIRKNQHTPINSQNRNIKR
jgi:hypothetical protein